MKLANQRGLLCVLIFSVLLSDALSAKEPKLDQASGLILGEGFIYVKAHCTACHSAKLITQNRMSREGWKNTITWMQETQGLWPLGEHEDIVLDYLEKHYHPQKSGRRANLATHLMPAKTLN